MTVPPPPLVALVAALLAACGPPSAQASREAAASPPVQTTALDTTPRVLELALPPPDTAGSPDAAEALPAPAERRDAGPSRDPLPDGFVRLSEVAPEIAREIRYTTAFNFVGAPIDGYHAPECILTEPAADALREVAADLASRDLGLKVYDCYRPQQAVDHFARWARGDDASMKRAFYPDEPKSRLFARGYIAQRSGHSRGSTVDLTLVRLPAQASVLPPSAYPTGEPLPRCDREAERFLERDLNMGTAYDCLSPTSATASRAVSAEARRNRQTLVEAMSRRGFRNYSKEWWHFTLRGEPFPRTYHDFPVE